MKKIIKCLAATAILAAIAIPCFSYRQNLDSKNIIQLRRIKFKPAVTHSDPYYKGTSKVGGKYQNILYNHIGNMEEVWDNYTGNGVLVADIDSGIDINHPDFTNNISNKSAYFYTEYEDDSWDSDFEIKSKVGKNYVTHDWDDYYYEWVAHGSNTAGVIAAEADGVGTVGIAYNASLLVLKTDFDDNSINAAIKYAVDNGAKVINMSFGGYAEPYYDGYQNRWFDEEYSDYFPGSDTSMVEALNYAHNHGVILVAAAGNECTDTHSYPACNNYVIGVGALAENSGTTAAEYSNYNLSSDTASTNPSVDISAPGTVVTPSYTGSKSSGKSDYEKIDGTSFSCPVVVGAAALWLEKNPTGTPAQFEEQLYASATDIGSTGWDKKFGYGAININKLLLNSEPIDGGDKEITSISLNKTELNLKVGETFLLEITTNPEGVPFEATYTSNNESVITVSNGGKITALKKGDAVITVRVNNLTATCSVRVTTDSDGSNAAHKLCGGNITTTSIFLSLTSALGYFLLKLRRK